MTVHKLRPDVVAHTRCPNGHEASILAINPVVRGGAMVNGAWPSGYEFCLECDLPVRVLGIEVVA